MEEHQRRIEEACEAAKIAKQVASQAEKVAQDVVERASHIAEKVLLFSQTMEYIQKDIAEIKVKLDQKYVTKDEFVNVRNIVYGLVSLILIGFVSSLIALVFIR